MFTMCWARYLLLVRVMERHKNIPVPRKGEPSLKGREREEGSVQQEVMRDDQEREVRQGKQQRIPRVFIICPVFTFSSGSTNSAKHSGDKEFPDE